ncbi:tumor necrosis factor alpha-induced protein 3-like [Anneissia japonica]|uniref:tumor necrosis factor alpha-induced protein 3-like n=1 Tax=Anneissia japonica TaxID=1529436 RepID=UPI00142567B5|nr:tumor necrosis factor alpha-induced protein 3-like [Anneissia japonica]
MKTDGTSKPVKITYVTMAPNETSKADESKSRPTRSALGLPQRIADCDHATKEKIRNKVKGDIFANPAPMMPHTFFNLSQFSFLLPMLWGLQPPDFVQALQISLIDVTIMKFFEDSGIINWSKSATKLFPLRTTGDGNCLLHAISLFLWGIEDLDLQMRRILYQDIFSDNEVKKNYKKRWQLGRAAFDQGIPAGGLRYDTMNWDDEWKLVIRNASPEPNPEGQHMLPYHSLEEIHIFIMANILKRPIIVLADTMFRDTAGRSLQPQNVTGIYLPVIYKAEECVTYPIVLGYHQNHFVPLVGKKKFPEEIVDMVLPLCTNKLEGFPVHFLLPEEEASKPRLLATYLKQKQLMHNTEHSTSMLNLQAVELGTKELLESASIMETYFKLAEKNYQAGIKSGVSNASISSLLLVNPPKSQSGKPSGVKLCIMCTNNPADGENDVCEECLVKNCTSFHPTASAPPESMQIGNVSKKLGHLKLDRSYDPKSELRGPAQNPAFQSPVSSPVTGSMASASTYAQWGYSIRPDRPCKTPRCQFFCSSELPGDYCHSCIEKAPMAQHTKLEKCRTEGCMKEANPERQGLCDICSGSEHLKKQRSLHVVGYEPLPSNQMAMASELRTSSQGRPNIIEDPSGLNSLAIMQTNVGSKKCLEPTCKLTGQYALQGFCSKCYQKVTRKNTENTQEEKPSNHVKQGSLEGVTSVPRIQLGELKYGSSSLQQPTGPFKCRTENCDLFGTREQNGFCTKCLNELTLQEHQAVCKNDYCRKKVFCDGYCKECYINLPSVTGVSMQSEARFQSEARREIAHPSVAPSSVKFCITEGCQDMIVTLGDQRHCYTCYQAQTSKGNPASLSRHAQKKCANQNCKRQTPPDQPLCVECQHILDTLKREETIKTNTMSNLPQSAPAPLCNMCGTRFAGHDGVCNNCRHAKLFEECYNTGLSRKEEFIRSQEKSSLCKNTGCEMFGSPQYHGFCSKCFTLKPTRPKESRSAPVRPSPNMLQDEPYKPRLCIQGCGNWANVQVLDGLCNECYQVYGPVYTRRPAQSATVEEPRVYGSEPRNRNRTDLKCFNDYCTNRGNPGAKGFCNSCFQNMKRSY